MRALEPRQVFLAEQSIDAGEAWRDRIKDELARASVLFAVIGDRWADHRDDQGRIAIQQEDDWVRKEIARGLERRASGECIVLQLRVDEAPRPAMTTLEPARLQSLAECQFGLELRRIAWKKDFEALVEWLRGHGFHTRPDWRELADERGLASDDPGRILSRRARTALGVAATALVALTLVALLLSPALALRVETSTGAALFATVAGTLMTIAVLALLPLPAARATDRWSGIARMAVAVATLVVFVVAFLWLTPGGGDVLELHRLQDGGRTTLRPAYASTKLECRDAECWLVADGGEVHGILVRFQPGVDHVEAELSLALAGQRRIVLRRGSATFSIGE